MNRFTLPDAQIDGEPLTGANIILVPDDPGSFAVAGGDPADVLHVTLKFLGDAADWNPAQRAACEEHVARWAAARKPYKAKCSGVGTLGDNGAAVYHLNMDGLTDDRAVLSAMIDDGTEPDTTDKYDGYTPHLTAGYELPALPPRPDGEHTFSKARIQWADEVVEFPLDEQPEAQVAATRRRIRRLPGRPVDPDFRHDYHDPSTGKFAPLGFVSPQVLKKLLSDDPGERFQAEMAIRAMFDKPGSQEWVRAFRDAPDGPGRSHIARKAREEVIGVRPVGSTPEARRKQQAWDRASDLVARGLTSSEPRGDSGTPTSNTVKEVAEAAPVDGSPATPTLLEAARMGGTVRATVVDVGRMRKFAEGDVIEARYRDDTYAAVYVPLPNGKRRRYLVRWDRLGDPQLEASDGAVYSTPEATAALVNTEGPQRLRVGSGRLSYLGLKAGDYVDVEPTGTAYGEVAGIVTGPNGRKYRVKWGHFDAVHPDGPEATPDTPEEDGSLESVDDDKLAQLKADAIDKLNLTPDDPTLAAELGAVLDEEARRAAEAGNTDREAKLRKNADHWWGKAGGRPTDRDGTDTEQPTPEPEPEPPAPPTPEPEPAPTPEPPSTGIGDGGGTYGPGDIPAVPAEYPTDKVSNLSYRMNDDGTVTLLLPDGAVMTIPLKAGSLWYGINRDTGLWDAKFQKSRPKAFAWSSSDYIYGGLSSKGNGADLVDQVLESDSYKARVVNRLVQRALEGVAVSPENQKKMLAKRFADLGFKGHTAAKGTVNPPEPTGRTKGPWGDDQALLDEMQAIFQATGSGYNQGLTPAQLRLEGWDKRIDAAIESLEARIVAGDLDTAQRHGEGLHRLRTAQTRANKRSDQFVTVYGGVSSNWEQNRAAAQEFITTFTGDPEWDKIVWNDAIPGTMTNGVPALKAWLEDPTDAKKASALAAVLAHLDALIASSATPMHADQGDDARLRSVLGMLNIHKDAMFDLPADDVIGSLLDPFTHDSLTAFRSAADQHSKSVGAKKRNAARQAVKETAALLDPPDINDPVEFIPLVRQLHGIGEGHLKHSEVRDLLALSFDERTSPSPSRTAALDEAVARVKWIDGKPDAYANGSLLAAPSSATDYAAINEGTYSKLGVSKYDLSHYGLRTGPKAVADQEHWDATWADVLTDERMSEQIDAWGAPIAVFFTKGSKGIAWAAPGTSQIGWSKNRATKHQAKYDESYAWVRENVVHEDAALVGEVPMSTAHVKAMMWPDGQMVKYGTAAHHYGRIEWGVDFTSAGFARHEYGHIVDGRLSKAKIRRQEYEAWAQYVQDHPEARLEISKYAKHNIAEAFAETYAIVMHPRYAERRGFSPEAEEMLRLFEAVIAPLAAEELGVAPADTLVGAGAGGVL